MTDHLIRIFPRLAGVEHRITSPQTSDYNCIAWAARITNRNWWPAPGYYWPKGIPRENTPERFIEAFALHGYAVCDSPAHEEGYEKVALYLSNSGKPLHMARQLPNGLWSSKLGWLEDIDHETPEALEGSDYGRASIFLKRPRV